MGKGVAIKDEKRTRHYRSPVHTDNVHLPRPTRRSRWSTVALRSLRLGAGGSCAPHRRYAVIAAPYTVFTKEATDPRTATGERGPEVPPPLSAQAMSGAPSDLRKVLRPAARRYRRARLARARSLPTWSGAPDYRG